MIDKELSKSVEGLSSPAERVNTRILLVAISVVSGLLISGATWLILYLKSVNNDLSDQLTKCQQEKVEYLEKRNNRLEEQNYSTNWIKDSLKIQNNTLKKIK